MRILPCGVAMCCMKEMKKDVKNLIFEFFRFGMVGVTNTVISIAVTYGLLFVAGKLCLSSWSPEVQMVVSSFLGFSCSFFNAYYWNSKLVFKKDGTDFFGKSFFKSYFCYFVTWLVSYIFTTITASQLSISRFWIPLLTLFVTVPLNFLVNKFWAFKWLVYVRCCTNKIANRVY